MSKEIESDYQEDYWNDEKHCSHCDSFVDDGATCFCRELEMNIRRNSHCDFFHERD
jgi:hypothetical protein